MTPSQLKYEVEAAGHERHFFDRKTMKFFGDTMRNYGVRKTENDGVTVWELYRKMPVKHGLQSSAFFRTSDFQQVSERR